jgi:hypothetical protein
MVKEYNSILCKGNLRFRRVGAERLACGLGVSRRCLPAVGAGFSTPPTEPDVQLSLHPALRLSVKLGLHGVTRYAVRKEVIQTVCIDWPFESSYRALVINFRSG